jgi:hypothetical protein
LLLQARKELNWPEGASSRESVRAVCKMYELQDIVLAKGLTQQHKDMVELVRQVCVGSPWVHRRRLTRRLWNTTSCLTVAPLTHSLCARAALVVESAASVLHPIRRTRRNTAELGYGRTGMRGWRNKVNRHLCNTRVGIQRRKVVANRNGRDFRGWEIAHAAVSRRPPIPL